MNNTAMIIVMVVSLWLWVWFPLCAQLCIADPSVCVFFPLFCVFRDFNVKKKNCYVEFLKYIKKENNVSEIINQLLLLVCMPCSYTYVFIGL